MRSSTESPDLFVFDLTATYRRNYTPGYGGLVVSNKNLLAAKNVVMDYNFATSRVEGVKKGFPSPF
jgi:hypothetical protein